MIKRLCSLAAGAAVSGTFVAGCGSSSSSSTSSAAPPAATSSSTSTSASTSPASSGGASANPAIAQAVAACKASISASPTLSADAKTKLQAICDQAASGDAAAIKKSSAEVCQQIVKDTVPSSSQAAALAACPKP